MNFIKEDIMEIRDATDPGSPRAAGGGLKIPESYNMQIPGIGSS